MKPIVMLLGGLLVAAAPAAAEPREEIASVNARWTEAVARKDMAAVESIIAPEFELTGGAATAKDIVPRAVWLANLQRMDISSYDTRITDLKVVGDIAVATVKGSWVVALGEEKRADSFELRDVWVRRPQGWQVVRRYIVGE